MKWRGESVVLGGNPGNPLFTVDLIGSNLEWMYLALLVLLHVWKVCDDLKSSLHDVVAFT